MHFVMSYPSFFSLQLLCEIRLVSLPGQAIAGFETAIAQLRAALAEEKLLAARRTRQLATAHEQLRLAHDTIARLTEELARFRGSCGAGDEGAPPPQREMHAVTTADLAAGDHTSSWLGWDQHSTAGTAPTRRNSSCDPRTSIERLVDFVTVPYN